MNFGRISLTFLIIGSAVASQASIIQVGNGAAVAGTETITWGQFGPEGTSIANDTPGLTSSGMIVKVKKDGGGLTRIDQSSGWNGNFAPNDELLWTGGSVGSMVFSFKGTVSGFGTQIQRNQFGAFGATMEAYGKFNNFLGSVSTSGFSSSAGDDSAVFLGFRSSDQDVYRVKIKVDGGAGDFAINSEIVRNAAALPVPEPMSFAVMALGAAGLIVGRRRHSK